MYIERESSQVILESFLALHLHYTRSFPQNSQVSHLKRGLSTATVFVHRTYARIEPIYFWLVLKPSSSIKKSRKKLTQWIMIQLEQPHCR